MGDRLMYKVEEGIEIPAKGKWKILATQMKPGDSVQVANALESRALQQAIVTYWKNQANETGSAANRPMRAMARSQDDGTYRVWRVS